MNGSWPLFLALLELTFVSFSNAKPAVLWLFLFVIVSISNSGFANMNEEMSNQVFVLSGLWDIDPNN